MLGEQRPGARVIAMTGRVPRAGLGRRSSALCCCRRRGGFSPCARPSSRPASHHLAGEGPRALAAAIAVLDAPRTDAQVVVACRHDPAP